MVFRSLTLLLLVLTSTSLRAQESVFQKVCRSDLQRFAKGENWDLVERSRFIALDQHLGELEAECKRFVISKLATKSNCLNELAPLCPGKELNRANRASCARKNAEALAIGCNQVSITRCEVPLKRAVSAGAADKGLGPECAFIPVDARPVLAFCGSDLGECASMSFAGAFLAQCVRRYYRGVKAGCQDYLYERFGQGSKCWRELHVGCSPEELKLQNIVSCFRKLRPTVSKECFEEGRFQFLLSSCQSDKLCDLETKEESLACFRKNKDTLSASCAKDLAELYP